VAVLADICRIDVHRMFAGGINAIVAAETISRDVRVIENSRHPKGAGVAVVTLIARNDMTGRFSGCLDTVVAGTAAAGHGGVIHIRDWAPCRSCVAGVTQRGRCNVIGRLH